MQLVSYVSLPVNIALLEFRMVCNPLMTLWMTPEKLLLPKTQRSPWSVSQTYWVMPIRYSSHMSAHNFVSCNNMSWKMGNVADQEFSSTAATI